MVIGPVAGFNNRVIFIQKDFPSQYVFRRATAVAKLEPEFLLPVFRYIVS